MNLKGFVKNHFIFLILIAVSFLINLYLFTGPLQYYFADDAVVGLMAKHFLEKFEIPLFYYGASHGGAQVLTAILIAPFFWLFGVSPTVMKLFSSLLYISLISFSYFFFRRHFGAVPAILNTFLLAVPFPILTIVVLSPSYGLMVILFNLWVMYTFFLIFFGNKTSLQYYMLFGAVSALAMWNLESIILLLFVCFLFWFNRDRLFFLTKQFGIYALAFLVVYSPVIYFNFTHYFWNFKTLFAESIFHKLVCNYNLLPEPYVYCLSSPASTKIDILGFLTQDFNYLFGKTFFGSMIYFLSFNIVYVFFLVILIFLIIANFHVIKSFILKFFKPKTKGCATKEFFVLVYVTLFIFAYFLRGQLKQRYFVDILFFVTLIISLGVVKLYRLKKNRLFRVALASFFVFTIAINLVANITLSYDKEYSFNSKSINPSAVVDFLEKEGITYGYSEHIMRWFLVFESKEKLIFACEGVCFCRGEGRLSPYQPYDDTVANSKRYAYVLWTDLPSERTFEKELVDYLNSNSITYNYKKIEAGYNKSIYYNFSEDVRPKIAVKNCNDTSMVFPAANLPAKKEPPRIWLGWVVIAFIVIVLVLYRIVKGNKKSGG